MTPTPVPSHTFAQFLQVVCQRIVEAYQSLAGFIKTHVFKQPRSGRLLSREEKKQMKREFTKKRRRAA